MMINDLKSIIYNQNQSSVPVNNLTKIPFMFSVFDVFGQHIPSEGLFYIDVMYSELVVEKNISYVKNTPIELEMCDKNKHLGQFSDMFPSFIKNNLQIYYCLTPDFNLTLFGNFGDVSNRWS
jgi:hypothetical protein